MAGRVRDATAVANLCQGWRSPDPAQNLGHEKAAPRGGFPLVRGSLSPRADEPEERAEAGQEEDQPGHGRDRQELTATRLRQSGRRGRDTRAADCTGGAAGRGAASRATRRRGAARASAAATAGASTTAAPRARGRRAPDPERLVLLRILAQLQLEVIALVRRGIPLRRRVRDQR